jgi:tRNA-splicing ligase RtcB (3'-phosphate/5'-hydroxy nucleic acid ligase)
MEYLNPSTLVCIMKDKLVKNYSITTDPETLKQFKDCYTQDYVTAAALMPDAHRGYAAPIGAVLVTKGYVVPAWVGFDIGCGVLATKLSAPGLSAKIALKTEEIYRSISKAIPLGKGQKNSAGMLTLETKEKFDKVFQEFKKKEYDKQILNLIHTSGLSQLGTLGGGNHFIEIGLVEDEVWLTVHSGSRALGHRIATHYMKAASKGKPIEQTFPLAIDSKEGKEYLNVQEFCLDYALMNREEMASRVVSILEKILKIKIKSDLWVNNHHNHVLQQGNLFIHRKGATPATKGERGVIPANMRDGVLLVEGKGNKSFLESSSHGAGRSMSRSQAKRQFTLADLALAMEGIKSSVTESVLDEIPMAYKDIHAVMAAQKDSVKVIKHIHPMINWKGSETNYLD